MLRLERLPVKQVVHPVDLIEITSNLRDVTSQNAARHSGGDALKRR